MNDQVPTGYAGVRRAQLRRWASQTLHRMGKCRKDLASGAFAGRAVTLSSTDQVDAYSVIADHFMSEIFALDPGEYLITDESDVLDFTPTDESDTSDLWRRVQAAYGIVQSDVNSGRLAKIFEAIANCRRVQ